MQVASIQQIIETLQNWDISMTESISAKMEAEKERRKEELMKKKEVETSKLVVFFGKLFRKFFMVW